MKGNIDLILVSAMIGRAIEDLIYRQMEDLQRRGTIGDEALNWLRSVSSFKDENGAPQNPLNFDRINEDLRILISLKEQIDKEIKIDSSEENI